LRTAIFGGTFDPIHRAHVRVAQEAADRFGLDQVLLITSGNPPHKPAGATTSYEHRHRMVELACEADPRLVPSRLEEGQLLSYSHHTIQRVRATLAPHDELLFLIGADAFAEIGTWYRSADVLRAVEFIVVSRPGYTYPVPDLAIVHRLETLALDVSSSDIRSRLAAGSSPDELSAPVLEYIRRHHLYQT
jgi:nicotinate-nucleotide adenylyltransferase